MKIDLAEHLIWLTRGRDWGFRFLSRGQFSQEIVQELYRKVFGKNGCGPKECGGKVTCGEHVYHYLAYRFYDECHEWKDVAGRSIPHEMIVAYEGSCIQCSHEELMNCVRPFYARQFLKRNEDVERLLDCQFDLRIGSVTNTQEDGGVSIEVGRKIVAWNRPTQKIEGVSKMSKRPYCLWGVGAGLIVAVAVLAGVFSFSAAPSGELEKGVPSDCGGVQLWADGPYWAECNIGATKPEDFGYYFLWGNTEGYNLNSNKCWTSVKRGCDFALFRTNCPTYWKSNSDLRLAGYIDSMDNLTPAYDAATAHLGPPWRMPTVAEAQELVSNCDVSFMTYKGVNGCLFRGRGAYSSKRIFLPASGYGHDASGLYGSGIYGNYWTATPNSTCSYYALYLTFYSRGASIRNDHCRSFGQPIRPLR